uniref:Uncharacterized protein n=1 Tax=Anguilla anguilla TaxID=7936 RepID=A0A0E9QBF9_ANGAN
MPSSNKEKQNWNRTAVCKTSLTLKPCYRERLMIACSMLADSA